jgi:hypothetical protein
VRLLASLAIWALAPGCGTVDPGPDTAPPAGCDAPAPFFVSDVWPGYFDKYGCGRSDCHDASTGHGYFRLQRVDAVAAPQPNDPVSSWAAPWRANLLSVSQNLSCANPPQSPVLAIPSGRGQPHPPGTTVTDVAAADALFRAWLK